MSTDHSLHQRVILHVDLDAFYVACERELNPSLIGFPVAVSQYNPHGNLKETSSSDIEKRLIVPGNDPDVNNTSISIDGRNGSMIAVSYEARAAGVKRGDRGLDAVQKCPNLRIVQVPVKRGKADLTMYRSASRRIIEVLIDCFISNINDNIPITRSDILVEKASIDEIYIDLTVAVDKIISWMDHQSESKHKIIFWNHVLEYARDIGATSIGGIEILSNVAKAANELSKDEVRRGSSCQVMEHRLDTASTQWWNRYLDHWTDIEIRLAIGAFLSSKARESVRIKFMTHDSNVFTLSGGISSNKTLAKLASGLKKPNRQTIINPTDIDALKELFHPLKLSRIRGLGGKFGEHVTTVLNIDTVGDLAKIPLTLLKTNFPSASDEDRPTADFLYDIARGHCADPVKERTVEKSMSSGKTFRRNLAIPIREKASILTWLGELTLGLLERLEIDFEDNARIPTLLVLSVKIRDLKTISRSAKAPSSLSEDQYKTAVIQLFESHFGGQQQDDFIEGMTVTGTNFHDVAQGRSTIFSAFKRVIETSSNITESSPIRKQSPARIQPVQQTKKRTLEALWKHIETKESVRHNENASKDPSLTKILSPNADPSPFPEKIDNYDDDDENRIDKSIFSSLPPSIQSEIRIAEMSKIGSSSRHRNENQRKGCIDKFLQKVPSSQISKLSRTTTSEKNKVKISEMENKSSSSSSSHFVLSYQDIDPTVLSELPFHIQAMIRNEIREAKARK